MYYEINENLARESNRMKSFEDYKENSTTNDYRKHIDEIERLAEELKLEVKYEGTKSKIDYCVNTYSKKYAAWVNKLNKIDCMCPSWLITGSSNYPMKKFEKQQEMYSRHMKEYDEFKNIEYKLKSILSGEKIISVSYKNAIQKLEEKIENLENRQIQMKVANSYYQKNKTMRGYKNLSDKAAETIDHRINNAYSWQKSPYPSYLLSNNNQEIRRLKTRLKSLKVAKEKPTAEIINKYFTVVENTENMKLQIIFDGKPTNEMRNILKDNGFRARLYDNIWKWQRKLTSSAKYQLEKVVEELEKLDMEIAEKN